MRIEQHLSRREKNSFERVLENSWFLGGVSARGGVDGRGFESRGEHFFDQKNRKKSFFQNDPKWFGIDVEWSAMSQEYSFWCFCTFSAVFRWFGHLLGSVRWFLSGGGK